MVQLYELSQDLTFLTDSAFPMSRPRPRTLTHQGTAGDAAIERIFVMLTLLLVFVMLHEHRAGSSLGLLWRVQISSFFSSWLLGAPLRA